MCQPWADTDTGQPGADTSESVATTVLEKLHFLDFQAFWDLPFVAIADELSGPNWGPLPWPPGMKSFARRP